MNKYFADIERWDDEQILMRAETLSDILVNNLYVYFGDASGRNVTDGEVTGTKPKELCLLGQLCSCSTWAEVLRLTLTAASDLEPEKMEILMQEYPSFIAKGDIFRQGRQLKNEFWYESNLSAKSIYTYCKQVIDTLGLSDEDWKVTLE